MRINSDPIYVGLRVDVDTLKGTQEGIPYLLDVFEKHKILSSIFFSVGPDNMGRHLWRLLKPAFLIKMLRSNAPGLYGWSILLQGTFWPGRNIAKNAGAEIKAACDAGQEIGLHAWDHHLWQQKADFMTAKEAAQQLDLGYSSLQSIASRPVHCSAVAGWKCTETILLEKQHYNFSYNSDCRGDSIFIPVVNGQPLSTPQIPVTLPTYDEIIGQDGINDQNYNEHMLSLIKPDQLNVLTIHAEVEGISRRKLFERFLDLAKQQGIIFTSLNKLLPENQSELPHHTIELKSLPGREGTLCYQGKKISG